VEEYSAEQNTSLALPAKEKSPGFKPPLRKTLPKKIHVGLHNVTVTLHTNHSRAFIKTKQRRTKVKLQDLNKR
jgi:hypothetical protein